MCMYTQSSQYRNIDQGTEIKIRTVVNSVGQDNLSTCRSFTCPGLSSCRRQTSFGPPALGLDEVLTTPQHKKLPCYETCTVALGLD